MVKVKLDHQKIKEDLAKTPPDKRVYPEGYKADETASGGRYLARDGKTLRNAHGQHIDSSGSVLPTSPVIEEPQIPSPDGLAPLQP